MENIQLNSSVFKMAKILFVCLGNICRSPSAEAVMNHLVQEARLQDKIECDSAGTSGYHDGETSDPRSIRHAEKRGYKMTSVSRRLIKKDLEKFDYIIAMDSSNLRNIKSLDSQAQFASKMHLMTEFCERYKGYQEVPDPWAGGPQDFEFVLDLLEDACAGLLKQLKI
jgi:protein-tyrosine phosphatase